MPRVQPARPPRAAWGVHTPMALLDPAQVLLWWEDSAPAAEPRCHDMPPAAGGAACGLCIMPHSAPCFTSRRCPMNQGSGIRDQGIPDHEVEFVFVVPPSR